VADKRCKVIISSAYGYFEYAKKAMQLGVLDFLVKPVKQEVLVAALNKAVDILDAEAEAADRLSRMAGMVESMGAR
jgi:two-component system response regulator YesN